MKHLRTPALIAGLLIASFSFADPLPAPASLANDPVKWLSWEEAASQPNEENRKYMVDLYTDWCGWCKKMDAATFQQDYISKYINEHYHAVKFNAEMKDDIEYKGETLSFVANGRRGYHELAAKLTSGRLGYPTIVFLDENMEVIQAIPGFKGPEDFEKILTYFAEDYHKKMSWDKYVGSYGQSVPAMNRE